MIRLLPAVILAAILFMSGCTAPDKATQVLRDQGYTNIEITGYAWFMCGDKDKFSTGFRATAPTGATVEGAVCSGWFKGYTIRFN